MLKNKIKKPIRIFEAFAGIGAQRKALENLGIKFEIEGMAEWYVPAIISYQAIHNKLKIEDIDTKITKNEMINFLEGKSLSMNSKEPVKSNYWKRKNEKELRIIYQAVKKSMDEGNIFDVRNLHKKNLKNIDLLTYSFPCQDLSQQGSQRGLKEGTRSGLLWEIEKALDSTPSKDLPKYLLMENVTALMFKTFKDDRQRWINKLSSLGYKNSIGILNSGDFGSPQARRRVFMISSLKGKIKLPKNESKPASIRKILDKVPSENDFMPKLKKYPVDKSNSRKTKSNIKKAKLIGYTSFNSEAYVYDPNFTGPTLTASGANSRIKLIWNDNIRKINAREAYQYMGFTKNDFNKVNKLNILTKNKMIYTCGNSISVEVLEAIFKEIFYEK